MVGKGPSSRIEKGYYQTMVSAHSYPTWQNNSGHRFDEAEIEAATRVLRSGHLSRVDGTEAAALEDEFAARFGVAHAAAGSSGSAVLHMAVAALDLNPGDEVICPPITDFGSVLGVLAQGLVPVFADLDPLTGCMTPETIEAQITPQTKAVMLVHLFGHAAYVEAVVDLCAPRGIKVIEDCAQAYLTETPSGCLVGAIGDIGCFSLQQSKHITTGDGGLAMTNDADLARRMRLFADKGWPRDTGERTHLFLGLNYRITDLVAAVGRVQLAKLDAVVADRRRVVRELVAQLDMPLITSPTDFEHDTFWLTPFVIADDAPFTNHEFCAALAGTGVPVVPGYLQRSVNQTPVFTELRTFGDSGWPLTSPPAARVIDYANLDLPVTADLIGRSLICLWANENWSADDIATAAAAMNAAYQEVSGG